MDVERGEKGEGIVVVLLGPGPGEQLEGKEEGICSGAKDLEGLMSRGISGACPVIWT